MLRTLTFTVQQINFPETARDLNFALVYAYIVTCFIMNDKMNDLLLSHQGPVRRLKPVNTGSLKHVTETLKNAERNSRPYGDLIPRNMQSRHHQRSHNSWDL